MVCVFTATTDELCSTPFPFRFMTGLWRWWPLAPSL
jgi:hypothetical protein